MLVFYAVRKPRSAAELARLVDVEVLPECDPRLFDSVLDTSVYYGVKEFLKTGSVVSVQQSQELLEDSEKNVGRRDDSVHRSQAEAAKPRRHDKNLVKLLPHKTRSSKSDTSALKQSSSSRRHRTAVKNADRSLRTIKSVNDEVSLAAALPRKKPRTEHRSERSVAKAHGYRKRKRNDFEEWVGRFPFMGCLMYDETAFSWHLPQLSFFAELDHNPDDPLLLISLCELDDIAAFQRQDFIHDLNSTFIGRKPRFSVVRSLYSDRTSHRLGQLSLQTYCDGHFIDCGIISHVHMSCLHHWATREPLETIVCNMLKDEHKPAVSLPYPPVRSLSDALCHWLSSRLRYLMSDVSINCAGFHNIFIGSSLKSELTANCLYQMFCRYVDFLCEKAEKYFRDVECGRVAVHAGQQTGKRVEPENYAAHAKLRRKSGKQTAKQLSSWQENVDNDYEDIPSEPEKYVLVDDADFEELMPLHDGGLSAEKDAVYRQRKVDAPAAHRKRKLREDYYDDHERWTSDVQSKARRVHQDHTGKENGIDAYRKKHDRETARRKEADVAKLAKQGMPSASQRKDVSEFVVHNDEDGTVIEAKSREVTREDELKSVDKIPVSSSAADNLAERNHSSLYSIVHDHCYSSASVCSMSAQSVASAVPEEHVIVIDADGSENVNPSALSTRITLPELTDAGENVDAEAPRKYLDGRKSQSPLPQTSSSKLQEKNEKVVCHMKDFNSASGSNVPHGPADVRDKSISKPLSQITQSMQLDVSASKPSGMSTATKLHPLSSDKLQDKTEKSVSFVQELKSASYDSVPHSQADVHEKSSTKPLSQKTQSTELAVSTSQTTGTSTAAKLRPLSSLSVAKTAKVPEPEVNAKSLVESTKQPVTKRPVLHKELIGPPQKVLKEDVPVTDVQKKRNSGENSHQKSDGAEVSLKEDCILVNVSHKTLPKAAQSCKHDVFTDVSKVSAKKIHVEGENAEKVSNKVDEGPTKIIEPEKVSANTGKACEAYGVPPDSDSKVAEAVVSVESEKTAAKVLPSAAELVATARAASHYQDAYLSDMADAYDIWPLSNFDPAFDPTNIPNGHVYNPFRKTWPILQHVIDGKADLLLKVFSFPDVSLFSIHRVMRENGFLWAVCLSLFEPALSKPDSMDSLLDSSAGNKVKGAKSTNPLMQAFRQAVEAKKKVAVAVKSKSAAMRQNSDDAGGTQPWATKRPAGKMSITFGSAVKSGGSLSSVVGTDQSVKPGPATNNFSNLLTSVITNMNSDMSELILWKCGKRCLEKHAHSAQYESSLLATSKHLSTLSDLTVDMYDRAEYKLEKIFSAKDAEKMKNIEKNAEGNLLAAAISKVAAATCQAHMSVSSPAMSSLALLSSDDASKASTAQVTHVSGSASTDIRSVSAATEPSIPQSTAAAGVATSGDSVCVASSAVPVTAKIMATTVADMLPPPLPPLSLSRIGVGFDSHQSAVTASSASELLTSWPSPVSSADKPVDQVSVNPPTCTAAYPDTVGGFAFPPPVSSQSLPSAPPPFSSSSLPLDQLLKVPPPPSPSIQPHLFSVPPPVGIPLNVPPPGFVNTSVPPPPTRVACPPPAMPWCPLPSSADAGYPASAETKLSVPASGFQKMPEVPNTAVLPGDVAANSPTPSGKATDSSSVIQKLQTSGVVVTSSCAACSAFVTSNASAISVTPSLIQGGRLRGPLKLVTPVTQSTSPGLACAAVRQVRPPFPSTASADVTQVSPLQNSNNQLHVSVPGTRPTVQRAGILGPGPGSFPVLRHSSRVPMQPVTANQNMQPNTSSPLVGQSLCGVFQPRLPKGQFARPTVIGSQPPSAIRPVSAQPSQQNDHQRATGPIAGQGPRGIVHPGPPMNQSAQPRSALPPDSQPRGPFVPVQPKDQPRATGPIPGQSPRGIVRPGPPMNQSTPPRGALPPYNQPHGPITPVLSTAAGHVMSQSPANTVRPQITGTTVSVQMSLASASPRGPAIRAESQLPSNPAQASGVAMHQPCPLAPAAGTGIVKREKGPPLTPNSRIYVLNSDSSPLCKDVEVSV